MAATTQGTQGMVRTIPEKAKDGLLEIRRILKRAEQLDESELRLLVEKLRAQLETGKEG